MLLLVGWWTHHAIRNFLGHYNYLQLGLSGVIFLKYKRALEPNPTHCVRALLSEAGLVRVFRVVFICPSVSCWFLFVLFSES